MGNNPTKILLIVDEQDFLINLETWGESIIMAVSDGIE